MAYGPAQRDLNELIPYDILSLLRGQTPRLSSGARPMDWIYVDDVVDGMIATAQSQTVSCQTAGLGTGVSHTAREAVEKIIVLMKSDLVRSSAQSRIANWRKSGLVASPTRG
jgi:UDP-glucose 4-epimerase